MPDDRSGLQIPTVALRFFNIFGPNQALVQSVYRRAGDLRFQAVE